jgi:hypothetical protein
VTVLLAHSTDSRKILLSKPPRRLRLSSASARSCGQDMPVVTVRARSTSSTSASAPGRVPVRRAADQPAAGSVGRSPRPRAATASTVTGASAPGVPLIISSRGHAIPTTPSTTSSPPTPGATTPSPPAWPAWTTFSAGSPDSSPAPPPVTRSRTSQRRPDGHGSRTGSRPQPGPPTSGYRRGFGAGSAAAPGG